MRARWFVAALLALTLVATAWSGYGLEQREEQQADPELLFLPNGKLLKVMALGHGPLFADVFYLWAIQHYSSDERVDRYRSAEHVFKNVITELDPHYIDAYWMGSMILILKAQDFDAGIRLLDQGIERNPDEWILPYLAGWESYHAGQMPEAQGYFRQAMRIDGSPAVLPRLIAGLEARQGSLLEATELLQETLDDPESDPASRAIARRQLRDLRAQADLQAVERAVERFRNDNGRLPGNLEELVAADYIRHLPRDPAGTAYVYDPASGRIASSAGRVLGEP